MEVIEKICYFIIGVSLISIFYISFNYIMFLKKAGIMDIFRWIKETISLTVFYILFTLVIDAAFKILRMVKREKRMKKSALAPYSGAAI